MTRVISLLPGVKSNLSEGLQVPNRLSFYVEQLNPGTLVHNLLGAWALRGALDLEAFHQALDALMIILRGQPSSHLAREAWYRN
jgi:hypothetical protein